MSSETKLDALDIVTETKTVPPKVGGKTKTKKQRKHHMDSSLKLAFLLFMITVLFFGAWKCFFDTDILGSWTFKITQSERKYTFNFTFEDNNVVRYHYGGQTYIGKYNFVDDSPQIHIFIGSLGRTYIDGYFDYEVSGNIFTGKTLKLTDRSGVIMDPDDLSSEQEETDFTKLKKKVAESVVEDNIRYYRMSFENDSVEPEIHKYDDFKTDEKLIGTWLYDDTETGYSYTITFGKDGIVREMSSEMEFIGAYTVKDGVCTYNFVAAGGTTQDLTFDYTIDGDKITVNGQELTRTNDIYAYQTAIK